MKFFAFCVGLSSSLDEGLLSVTSCWDFSVALGVDTEVADAEVCLIFFAL